MSWHAGFVLLWQLSPKCSSRTSLRFIASCESHKILMIFAALSALLTNANQQKQNHGAERSESEVRLGFRIRTFTLGGSFVNACSLLWVARDMGHMAHTWRIWWFWMSLATRRHWLARTTAAVCTKSYPRRAHDTAISTCSPWNYYMGESVQLAPSATSFLTNSHIGSTGTIERR